MATASTPTIRIGILAYPGCLPSEVFGVSDVLEIGGRVAGATSGSATSPFDVRVVTARRSLRLDGPRGVTLQVAPAEECDLLVVPGFAANPVESEIEAVLAATGPEQDFLRARVDAGTQVLSVCVGAFLLAEAGLLDGRTATTSWLHAPLLRARHPRIDLVEDRLVVHDRGVTTAAAFSAMYDATLELLEAEVGARTAEQTARIMLLDASRDTQAPYVDASLLPPGGDSFGAQVQRWLRDHLAEPFDLRRTASEFAVSPRTLSRRFAQDTGTTPLRYLHAQRMHRAKHLLRSTSQSVAQVAARVGHQDAASFSQLFRREVGLSPRDYRARFASCEDPGTTASVLAGPAGRRSG